MVDINKDLVLPYADQENTPLPSISAREQATYTGELSDMDAISTANNVEFDLSTSGRSSEYDAALARWKTHQETLNRDAVIDIVSDPEMDKGTKLAVVEQFKHNKFQSESLRDAFVIDSASNNETPLGEVSLIEDFDAQQLWIDKVRENVGFADEVQSLQNEFGKDLSGSTEGALASLVFDALAPTDIHSINTARIARDLGVSLESEDLPMLVRVLAESPLFKTGMFNFARDVIFNGSLSKKIGETFNVATPEQQRNMMEIINETAGDSFGTDFNKWTAMMSATDPVVNPLGVAALDFLGVVGTIPVIGAMVSPIKTARHYLELTPDALSRKLRIHDTPPTIVTRDEFVGPPHPPTGQNQPDIVVSPTNVDAVEEVQEVEVRSLINEARDAQTRRNVGPKVFTQTDQAAKRGNVVARISSDKIEEAFKNSPDYIPPSNVKMPEQFKGMDSDEIEEILELSSDDAISAIVKDFHISTEGKDREDLIDEVAKFLTTNSKNTARKDYKDFSRVFDKEPEVKAPTATVDQNGNFKFTEGTLRYAVMRDKGISEMAVSLDPISALNAHSKGLLTDIALQETVFKVPQLTNMLRTRVPAGSPAGVMAATNPVKAANRYASAVASPNADEAIHLGTSKGQIIADGLFTKLDTDLDTVYPNIYQKLKTIDNEVHGIIKQTETNALVTDIAAREREVDEFLKVQRGLQGGVYNQANSTIHFGRVQAEGIATYGRTADYGWNTAEEANVAREAIAKHNPNFETEVVQIGGAGQWYVQQTWNKPFNQSDRWMFGAHSMDSSVLGINTSALSRTAFGDMFVFPKTMRGDPDFAKAGLISEYNTSAIESRFFGIVRNEIMKTPHWKQLNAEFNMVQETGEWIAPHQFASRHPDLDEEGIESLANSYYMMKRYTDYLYDMVNITKRNEILAKGSKALVDDTLDMPVGYGKEVNPESLDLGKVKTVWDFDTRQPFTMPVKRSDGSIDLKGRTIVELDSPAKSGNQAFEYGIIGAKVQMKEVPTRVLPKIAGWLPRRNTEAWYIRATPNSLTVNGVPKSGQEAMAGHVRTIGAGSTREEAEQLIEKLQARYPDHNLKVSEAQENVGDNALTDYQLYSDVVRSAKKRGERLPTLHGQSRLEEPVQAAIDSTKILSRQFAMADHVETFKKDFMKSFNNFVPPRPDGGKEFPNSVDQLQLPPLSSPEEIKRFQVAQRLLIQFKDQMYTATKGDDAVRDVLNAGASKLEKLGFGGKEIADVTREMAKQGNVPVRLGKTLTSHLYLYLSNAQWFVQTQQLIELSAIQPSLLTKTFTQVPAIVTSILARAPHLGYNDPMRKAVHSAASKFSLMDKKEFDDLVDIIYNSGLPQSVDLNQMLHGMWQQSKVSLDPSLGRQGTDLITNLVSMPGKIGKTVGYGPAELAANVGTWLYARDRFLKNNPGADWKSQQAVARITADAWDINHSMTGRSGSMEFQKGALGLAMQFFAVQIKGFMQLLSSKTLSAAEKTKLAVARLTMYGMYGVPLGGAAMAFMDRWVDDTKDPEIIDAYSALKGGMIDATANTMLDIAHSNGKELDTVIKDGFTGKGTHDIQLAKRISPVPDTALGIPQLEVLNEMYKVAVGESPNGVRFPFINAFGSLGKATQGMMDMWRATDLDTDEKVVSALERMASASSLGNNYNKAMAMQIARDKISDTGSRYGMGEVTLGKIGAQFFGITTREEENTWKVTDIMKEREKGIQERSDDIMRIISKLNQLDPDSFDYEETVQTMNALLAFTDPGDREAVRASVENKILDRLKQGTMQEHYATRLWNWHADGQDKKVNDAIQILKRNAPRNPKMAEMLELLQNTGYFEDK